MGYPKTLYVEAVTAPFFGRAWTERPIGYSVRYEQHDDEAQAEIDRLQAEVERLRKLNLKLSMERHVPAMRVADKMHKQQAQATDDYMALQEQLKTARNDALEDAAALANTYVNDGGLAKSMAFFVDVSDYKSYKQGVSDYAAAIRSLKRPAS